MPGSTPSEHLPPFLPPTAEGVAQAARLLQGGDVVAVPTETVYGLAAHALDERAVRHVFAIKGRPLIDPLIVHGLDADFFADLAEFTPLAHRLAEACWPGPLTLIVPKTPAVPALVTAGRSTVAVRAPAHPVMRALLETSRLPLAAPSANPFGYLSPTRAEHVRTSFSNRVPWILDGGPCDLGLESTIVDASDPSRPVRILRPGPITADALSQILGQRVEVHQPAAASQGGLMAPGLLSRHYSPHTPLVLLEPEQSPPMPQPGQRTAWVRIRRPAGTAGPANGLEIFWLSEDGQLTDAAHQLYDLLRRLDTSGFEKIWCETAVETGWGMALNDRLRRAAGQG